jgi:hypothetical protein
VALGRKRKSQRFPPYYDDLREWLWRIQDLARARGDHRLVLDLIKILDDLDRRERRLRFEFEHAAANENGEK